MTPVVGQPQPLPPDEERGWLTSRQMLWIMVFLGFAVNYMIRININIALVAMVKPQEGRPQVDGTDANGTASPATPAGKRCFGPDDIGGPGSLGGPTAAALMDDSVDVAAVDAPADVSDRFDWDEHEQGMVLGAFFWLYWSTQVPGGVLARRYGTKLVFGLGNVVPAVLALAIPFAARAHYGALLFIRLAQGCIQGFTWPAMHDMTAKWIPPGERSRFVTAYLGGSLGAAVTYPVCGLIIDALGWEAVFYISGSLGVLWWFAWAVLVYDSPDEHPRIAASERLYIQKALAGNRARRTLPTPWRRILLSLPVWMNVAAQWGALWGLLTLMTQGPTYFRFVHGWSIRMTGLLSGLPQLARVLFAAVCSTIGDYLLKSGRMSRTNIRKLATAISNIVQGLFVLGLAFSGCDRVAAVFCLVGAAAANGAVSAGALASMVDISPNFASIIMGINGVVTVLPGFISPIVVGALTFQNQSVEQWRIVFLITAATLVLTGVPYVLFGRSDVQPWNEPQEESTTDGDQDADDRAITKAPGSRVAIVTVSSKCSELKPVC